MFEINPTDHKSISARQSTPCSGREEGRKGGREGGGSSKRETERVEGKDCQPGLMVEGREGAQRQEMPQARRQRAPAKM